MSDRAYKQSYDGGKWRIYLALIIIGIMFSFPKLARGEYPLKIVHCTPSIDCNAK